MTDAGARGVGGTPRASGLVGREAVVTHLVAAASGPGAVLRGARGSGRSVVLGEAASRLEAAGARVVRLHAAGPPAPPFGALRRLLGTDLRDEVDASSLAEAADALLAASGPAPGTSRPVVAVDGVDELDGASAAVLHQLLAAGQVTLLATACVDTGPTDPSVAWWRDLADRIELDSLDRDDADRLAERLTGGPIDASSRERLWQLARGHAGWLVAAVRATRAAGGWERSGGLWCLTGDLEAIVDPDVLVEVDATPPAARSVLQALALADALPIEAAEALGGSGPLTDAERRGLVRVDEDEDGELWCAVASRLVAAALRATLDPETAVVRWSRVADVLAESGSSVPEAVVTRGVALVGARRLGPDADPADPADVEAVARAADAALLLSRWEVCADLAGHAWRAGRDTSILTTLTQALGFLSDHASIRELSADLERTAPYPELARHHAATIAISQFHSNDPDGAWATTARARAEAAEADRPAVDIFESRLRAFHGEQDAAHDLVAPWLDHPDPATRVEALTVVASVAANRGDGRGAITTYDEAFALALAGPDAPTALAGTPYLFRLGVLGDRGQTDEAIEGAEAVERESARAGDDTGHGWLALHLGRNHLRAGRPRTAARWFGESVSDLRRVRRPGWVAHPTAGLVAALAAAGDLPGAREAEATLAEIPAHAVALFRSEELRYGSWLAAATGDAEVAATRLRQAAASARDAGSVSSEAAAWHDLARLGGPDDRLVSADELARLTGVSDSPLVAAHATQARALVDGDVEGLMVVAEAFGRMGVGLDAAESWAEAARRSDDDRLRAHARRRVAEIIARSEGLTTPLLGDVEPRPALTDREAEIAAMVVAGASRQDIAAVLVVSVRTIDSHLQRVYRKLGVRGREGLVVALGESDA